MTFRVSEPQPARISLASAFQWILEGSYNGEANQLIPLLHMAAVRVWMSYVAPPGGQRSNLPDCPGFTVDPIDVAHIILQGISAGKLSVGGANEAVLSGWCRTPWLFDWERGIVEIAPRGFVEHRFCPTIDVVELKHFLIDGSDQDATASEKTPHRPISNSALFTFLEGLEGEKIKEADANTLPKLTSEGTQQFDNGGLLGKHFLVSAEQESTIVRSTKMMDNLNGQTE